MGIGIEMLILCKGLFLTKLIYNKYLLYDKK